MKQNSDCSYFKICNIGINFIGENVIVSDFAVINKVCSKTFVAVTCSPCRQL
jgi:hypothetical protein